MALTATVTPGKTFIGSELVSNAKLNQLGAPTVALAGTTDTTEITNDSVTAAKLAFAGSGGGAPYYCAASTSANVITLTASGHALNDDQLVAGSLVIFKADATNTATVDIRLSSVGTAKNLYKDASQELAAGDLRSGQMVAAEYDGTQWQLVSNLGNGFGDRFATTGGTSTAYTATFAPTLTELVNGTRGLVKWHATNTGSATFSPDNLSPKAITKGADSALVAGDVLANQISALVYDSTLDHWLLTSPVTQSTRTTAPVRQCVLNCSVASTGLPNYMTGVGTTAISFQNCDTTNLVVAFAAGFDSSGAVDYVGVVSTNTSNVWSSLSTNGTYYLWVDRDTSTGALTYGKTATTLRPAYSNAGSATDVTDTQHTYLINQGTMWVGNGSTVSQVQRVFLGEVVVAGVPSVVSSITPYMPRGEFQSGTDAPLGAITANTTYTATHQIGVTPRSLRWVLVCGTTDLNYADGDQVDATSLVANSTNIRLCVQGATETTAFLVTPFAYSSSAALPDKTSYTPAAITAARWTMRCYASRGW